MKRWTTARDARAELRGIDPPGSLRDLLDQLVAEALAEGEADQLVAEGEAAGPGRKPPAPDDDAAEGFLDQAVSFLRGRPDAARLLDRLRERAAPDAAEPDPDGAGAPGAVRGRQERRPPGVGEA